ncbi:IclR family transcriptional regulator C-terminal domain-containing protein [Alpinimonas psychrophila]|nr:IclR family transcriptional regulator C-terminal domain-containing protein [Alpinimonas psychrophila]
MEPSGEFVQSLARGLTVIRAFSGDRPALTLTDVADATQLSRATARRFLLTLEQLGYVRTDGKLFSLTPRVLELGYSYLSSLGLPEIIAPHLETLAHDIQESASAAVLDGGDIVYIARVAGRKIMRVQITVGTRFPAYATSMGRVLLAALPESDARHVLESSPREALTPFTKTSIDDILAELASIRHNGYALLDQELELGLRSLAVPVHDSHGNVVAAVNVSTVAGGTVEETTSLIRDRLQQTATDISCDLASRPA